MTCCGSAITFAFLSQRAGRRRNLAFSGPANEGTGIDSRRNSADLLSSDEAIGERIQQRKLTKRLWKGNCPCPCTNLYPPSTHTFKLHMTM